MKQSQFTKVGTLGGDDYIPAFGQENKAIKVDDFLAQARDEIVPTFIYKTIALLQEADLEIDADRPIYVRCEETEYRLYKITNAAASVDDIPLNNGATATFQVEYRDIGFVIGPDTSTARSIALFKTTDGAELEEGPVITDIGEALVSIPSSANKEFFVKNTGNSVSMLQAQPFFDQVKQNATESYKGVVEFASSSESIDSNVTDRAMTPANTDVLLKTKTVLTVNTFADLASTEATVSGMIVYLKQHTSGGIGGGFFQDMAGTITNDGGTKINNIVTTGRYWNRINYSVLDVKMFGAIGDGLSDDTVAIQNAINVISLNQGYQTISGAITGGFVSNVTPLEFPRGIYLINNSLNCPSYFTVFGDNSVIIQSNVSKDIFSCSTAYQWNISNISFSGGRHHAYLENNNIDVTRWEFKNCTFSLSANYAIKTFPTGGVTSHLSANLTVSQCAFYKPRQAVLNYCDSFILEDSWVFVSKDNFSANTAVFVNSSITTDGFPMMFLRNMFGVPSMGTQGVDRLANVRWCDHNAGGLIAENCRFGGEFAGMPPIYFFAPPKTVAPYIGPHISIRSSQISAGPSSASDSGVIVLNGQIPHRISIRENNGVTEVPYVINYAAGIPSIPAYFSNWETSSGRKAWEIFTFDISNNQNILPDGIIYFERIPYGMRRYLNNFRQTKVTRASTQVLTNGVVNNFISFDTVNYDTQGGFNIINPTRLVMPAGASKLRIQLYFHLDGGWTAGSLIARVQTSSGVVVASNSFATNANADNTAYTYSVDVDAIPGEYFQVNILHNAATNKNLTECIVVTTATDYI